MKIAYHKQSLFDVPKGSVLVHACNAQGKWGSGIAAEFYRRFPQAFLAYEAACRTNKVLGGSLVIRDQDYYVGCLVTSFDYGPKRRDPPEKILEQTKTALSGFLGNLPYGIPIYSCKFNAGLFAVPWEKTEALLLEADDDRVWNVCSLD